MITATDTQTPKPGFLDKWYSKDRLGGLRRFAIAITVLNLLGHFWFGFEQSFAHPLVALLTTYSIELLLESIDAITQRRRPRYANGLRAFVDFLLPAHISGLAVAMLTYSGDRLMPVVFAGVVAMASKTLFKANVNGRPRHIFNPSNFGITITLLCFTWVGIAPPYMFTENLNGFGNVVLPLIIICSGSLLNTLFTRRLPLIATWLSMFALQAVVRCLMFDTPITAGLMPMSGVAFLLFTFYMVTDPPTTPSSAKAQVAFGASVAIVYSLLMIAHVVFGLFFALTIVATIRGAYLYWKTWQESQQTDTTISKTTAVPSEGRFAKPAPVRSPVQPVN